METSVLLKGYLNDEGKMIRLPGKKQKKKLAAMLEYFAHQFSFGKVYSEMEVNHVLNEHHSFNDPATLRRLLFTSGFLNRTLDGREYRKTNKSTFEETVVEVRDESLDVYRV